MTNAPAVVDRPDGDRRGPYRLERPIGSGGMGTVWRAWDERLERWVALKQIRTDVTLRHGRERLWREARAAARLNHPSIVHVYDILEGTDGDWIVMELVEGKTIRCLLDEETTLSGERVVRLCREIAEGLAEAHAQGILHRDLKATNVLVAPSGRAKILDFGLAKEMPREEGARDRDLTQTGVVLGTCYAMSPEQVLGRALDERSDLFSLGSLLYEMLTGVAPFRAESNALSLVKVLEFTPPPLQRSHPDVPPALCDLVGGLLQKEPHNRPGSAAEVLAALDSVAHPAQPPARPLPTGEATARTFAERRPDPADQATLDQGHRQSGGERRTVTIACCGLVQLDRSSGEVGALDLEVLSEAAIAFEALGREICQELSGTFGAVLGRTLWLSFGYPRAHENDAERAIRAVRELRTRLAALPVAAAHRLTIRTGVHTGPAVVVTRPSSGQTLQPGDTFDIALAIQSHVPAGKIGVSAASCRLLEKRFAVHPLPAVYLRDIDATVAVYELGSPLEPGSEEVGPAPPLINREAELQILLDRFQRTRSVGGQAILITGEAGIGKSRLVRALAEHLSRERAAEAPVWLTAHGSVFTQNTPLAPIVHLLERVIFAAETAEGSAEDRLRRLEEVLDEHGLPRPDYAPLLGELLSLPVEDLYPPLVLSPEARRKRTLAAIVTLLAALAERQPVVLVIEDLHWIDPSTLELLDLLMGELPMLSLLLIATFRPELAAPWRHQTSVTQLGLGGLSEDHAVQLIRQLAEGTGLPTEMQREIVVRTDGNPLFVEELTKAVLERVERVERGEGGESGDGGEAEAPLRQPAGIPVTLGTSLLARLDRLGEAKGVAQLAAVLGRTFSLELLEALSWIKGAALSSALGRLVQAEILYRRGPASAARYIFKHALIQDAAYLSLLASDRQQLHRRLAGLLREDFPAVAEAEPELMAHHCERGGLTVEAVDYLLEAGLRSARRSAHLEAMSHLNRGLGLLRRLPPEPELSGRELALRSALVVVLEALKGWGAPEVADNAERCVALCRELGESAGLIQALSSLWAHHLLRADRQPTADLAAEIARLAETPAQVYMGHATRAYTAFYAGRFTEALELSEQAVRLYEPDILPELAVFGDDSILMPHLMKSWALCTLGDLKESVHQQAAALAIAETLGSPFALGMALVSEMTMWRDLRLHEPDRFEQVAERLMALAGEQEFIFLYASAQCGKGWALCQRGEVEEGVALIRTGLDLHEATGARLMRGYWFSYLIEACLVAGRLAEGLTAVREALALSETQLDLHLDSELLRLEGELLHAAGDFEAAEAALRKSLEIARGQGARAFELRALTCLGRLLAERNRGEEVLSDLATVLQAFSPGFTTRDLTEARELLDRLGFPG